MTDNQHTFAAADGEYGDSIAEMLKLGSAISEIIAGEAMDGSLNDLGRLQTIVDSGKIPEGENRTDQLHSLGVVLGQVFINDLGPGWNWWWRTAKDYEAPCVRYQETDIVINAAFLISKRLEANEDCRIEPLYRTLKDIMTKEAAKVAGG